MNIKTVSIVGAGFMGEQIAARTAIHGYVVKVHDIDQENLKKTEKSVRRVLKRKKPEFLQNIFFFEKLEDALIDADLIIEAIPERLELKKEIFSKIDKMAPKHAIIATNSSSIPVSKIENAVERKDKILNIHFYAPIPVRPMADIMKGTQTSEETFNAGIKWIKSIECEPLIVKKECLGFVFNRIWRAVKKECLKIWAGGYADIETVDKAWRIFTGMNMGPFQMMDGVGLDVVYDIEMSYYKESGDPDEKPPEELKKMIEKGELGIKSGKGFYKWR